MLVNALATNQLECIDYYVINYGIHTDQHHKRAFKKLKSPWRKIVIRNKSRRSRTATPAVVVAWILVDLGNISALCSALGIFLM